MAKNICWCCRPSLSVSQCKLRIVCMFQRQLMVRSVLVAVLLELQGSVHLTNSGISFFKCIPLDRGIHPLVFTAASCMDIGFSSLFTPGVLKLCSNYKWAPAVCCLMFAHLNAFNNETPDDERVSVQDWSMSGFTTFPLELTEFSSQMKFLSF